AAEGERLVPAARREKYLAADEQGGTQQNFPFAEGIGIELVAAAALVKAAAQAGAANQRGAVEEGGQGRPAAVGSLQAAVAVPQPRADHADLRMRLGEIAQLAHRAG